MSDSNMSDEEFKQFLLDNMDRIKSVLGETKETTEERVKSQISETKDQAKDVAKDIYGALMNPEVHKHLIKMGAEFMMAMGLILSNMPVPEKVTKVRSDFSEASTEVKNEFCKHNDNCAVKNKAPSNLEKIDIE